MSRTEQTKTLTGQAFWVILATGKPPTVDLVNDWLETGGHGKRQRNAISEALKDCWVELGKRSDQTRTIPGIPPETINLVVSLRDNMLELARNEFEADKAEIQRIADLGVAQAQESLGKAEAAVARARGDLLECETRIEHLQAEKLAGIERASAAEAKLDAEVNRSRELFTQIGNLESDHGLAKRELSELKSTHEAAMASEKRAYADMRRSLQQQFDNERTERQAVAKKVEDMQAQLKDVNERASSREREILQKNSALSAELGKLQGSSATIIQQLESVSLQYQSCSSELAVAQERIGEVARSGIEAGYLLGITPTGKRKPGPSIPKPQMLALIDDLVNSIRRTPSA
jgi:uncharacterized phage infection (PIP) family protein YhgE